MQNLAYSVPVIILFHCAGLQLLADDNWHQPAGPNGNWQVDGIPPVEWSVTRNENIRWRTLLPEAGQSGVKIWGDRVFVTTHVPIKSLEEKSAVTDIIRYCLNADTGMIPPSQATGTKSTSSVSEVAIMWCSTRHRERSCENNHSTQG